ncbi:RING-type domain-containing protein [Mycena indigotica]|uniref:RING-type domain-containing protein n=1 Tax=Mycena indigotica TaxID=2126181 RepID=A0A8H6TGW5_9AGAR|nr:RING-type domain-containing protein [Mycena indigotica]KAF7316497.1 RING-type domain-containing protein [Mycena indigotica]
MPRQPADVQVSPYLTHLTTHHGQVTLVPADNNGRRRKANENLNSSSSSPRSTDSRVSTLQSSPTKPRTSPSGGIMRRIRHISRQQDSLEDIPDYPPPSFQEAMASTTTLTTWSGRLTIHSQPDSDSESDDDGESAERASVLERPPSRGRGILDSEPDDGIGTSVVNTRPHRRHMSLSPLRTLFPPARNNRESSYSAPSHPLSQLRNSPHSRSTTSLRAPPSPPVSPSIRSENPLGGRRFFSHKDKDKDKGKAREALDSWQIVESQWPPNPSSPILSSPIPSSSQSDRASSQEPPTPTSISAAVPSQGAFPREKAIPIISSSFRERERRQPQAHDEVQSIHTRIPPSPTYAPPPTPTAEGPPIVTVRSKKPPPPPPPPKRKPQLAPSPLRESPVLDADLERAVRTPLPLTPVIANSFSFPSQPASRERKIMFHSFPASEIESSPPSSAVDSEGHRHHYPGRPLPIRPRLIVDSTYAHHPHFPPLEIPLKPPHVPEGLLIDLDDEIETPVASTVVDIDETPTVTPTVHAPGDVALLVDVEDTVTPAIETATPSSALADLAPLVLDPTPHLRPTLITATSNRQSSASSVVELAPTAADDFLEITDLDVLLSRIENDQRDGSNYEALLMVSDFIGPASPLDDNKANKSVLRTGTIEVARRRVLKDGRVKLKLVLLGTTVDRCGICMSQFKKAQAAKLSERCGHVYHEQCLARWTAKSRTCPLCRIPVREMY